MAGTQRTEMPRALNDGSDEEMGKPHLAALRSQIMVGARGRVGVRLGEG